MRKYIFAFLIILGMVSMSREEKEVKALPILTTILHSNQRDTVMLQSMMVKEFKNRLAELESPNLSNPYSVVNRYGYMGKYQISKEYLDRFGKGLTKTQFLKNPWKQEVIMNRLCIHYLDAIHDYGWEKYIGQTMAGITITLEGLMAGYHQHPFALQKFLKSNGKIDLTDGNKCPVSTFIRQYDGTTD